MALSSCDAAFSTVGITRGARPLGKRHQLTFWGGGVPRPLLLPEQGEVLVGRQGAVDVLVEAPTVSRQHARLSLGPPVRLTDLGSRNFTYVNGQRLVPNDSVLLAYGDVIAFGEAVAVFDEVRGGLPRTPEEPDADVFSFGTRALWIVDPAMRSVYSQLRRFAPSQLAVLITGETGTGKDLAATALHAWSKRSDSPMLTLNCAALPEGLAESELFGHVRGAFSGAVADRAGLFESAHGGTVFFDEVGDLPLTLQPKLLRVLENKTVTRIGSVQERPVDVRVVAATHRDLAFEVRQKRFREDLFYRLGAATVVLPPLRERPRELSLLAREFLRQARTDLGRETFPLTDEAMARLAAHPWDGNVRELKNVIAYVAALFDGPVSEAQISNALASNTMHRPPLLVEADVPVGSLRAEREQLERRRIQAALAQNNGNKTRAAKALGMPLRTLTWKLKRYATRG